MIMIMTMIMIIMNMNEYELLLVYYPSLPLLIKIIAKC